MHKHKYLLNYTVTSVLSECSKDHPHKQTIILIWRIASNHCCAFQASIAAIARVPCRHFVMP